MRNVVMAAVGLCMWAGTALAHGPTPQRVEESVTIAAEPAKVWSIIADFAGIQSWHPMVEASAPEGDAVNAMGAKRKLTLEKGDLVDRLDRYDAGGMIYGYRLSEENPEALAVSFYSATLAVKPADGGSELTWGGRFYRADTGNSPAETMNDEAGHKALSSFFRTGIENVKAMAEGAN
ncbi:SRPBCC family protein [Marinivivus vitaminiproducens]|uniref:SRPBCC family protein n=1 Tax=Marinivivus vitaminiproducens TaxID=3035935 RepID=UPI0027A1A21F|nr:SRPBCC family protein [Geminicoccaceae bacterium SCSIO 64248]